MRYTNGPARREELVRQLAALGYVSSAQVSAELGVSEMTIRRDLHQLELEGHACRVIGGARLSAPDNHGLPFEERDRVDSAEKSAIAIACAREILGAATLALDAGTTVAPLADLVETGVTVITHSVPVINACTARHDLDLIVVGGVYEASTRSFNGPMARANLENVSADIAVLSATAVDSSGMLCANSLDAEIKQSMAGIAARTILLVDHTKIGARAPIRFGTLRLIDLVITDSLATPQQIELLRNEGAEVIVVDVRSGSSAA